MRRTGSAVPVYLSNPTEGKPMASKYWIKLYHEILDDPKMGRLPDMLFRRAIEFFLIAGERGREGDLPPLADIAWRLRADEISLLAKMEDLEALNILSRTEDGGWRVAHFKERQAAAPMIERVHRHRELARSERFAPGDPCNASPTERCTDTDGSGLQVQAADIPEPQRPPGAQAKGIGRSELSADIPELLRPPGAQVKGIGITGQTADATIRYTDTDIDIDTESEPDEDAEAEGDAPSARNSGFQDEELVKLFIAKTGLPLFFSGEDKWARALERMQQASVEEADLEQAIDECRTKGLTIASLASLVNPAIIARSRRLAGRPEEDYRRYLKGEYGEFGR